MLPVVAVPAIPKFSANGTVVIWPDAFSAILQPQTRLLEKHSGVKSSENGHSLQVSSTLSVTNLQVTSD